MVKFKSIRKRGYLSDSKFNMRNVNFSRQACKQMSLGRRRRDLIVAEPSVPNKMRLMSRITYTDQELSVRVKDT